MKNEKGATSLQILLTVVILLIIGGTAIAMIAGSFEEQETVDPSTNQVQQDNQNVTNTVGEETNEIKENEE